MLVLPVEQASLTFEGASPPGNPGLPQLAGFQVVPGTSQRTEMTFINGQQSLKSIFDYFERCERGTEKPKPTAGRKSNARTTATRGDR